MYKLLVGPTMDKAPRKSFGIVSGSEGERPRERLLPKGAQSLTDAELIAILLRSGIKGTNAVELVRQILKKFGSIRALTEATRWRQ
jgi:DNA repair protein RadC